MKDNLNKTRSSIKDSTEKTRSVMKKYLVLDTKIREKMKQIKIK